ncbi:alpha-L-rhamnosidase C-terminal domain-containing protein [Paraglaciecola sp.]|uniref:alpha-L-rhamnosidase-related protein n=1 Tax=Paraglaciecola sp. TaxID=1920173 RepID=UPI00326356F5
MRAVGYLFFIVYFISCSPAPSSMSSASSEELITAPIGLLTELLRWPEKAVITDVAPEFSWRLGKEGQNQQAFQILVANNQELLAQENANMWDSGKVEGNANLDIEYAGTPLQANTSYYWKVRVWTTDGELSHYSQWQQFNMGETSHEMRSELWPGESQWVELTDKQWVSEDRQTAMFEDISPVSMSEIKPNIYLAEFEKAAFSTLKVTITASEVAELTVFLGERLSDDGLINKHPGHSFIGYEKLNLSIKKGTHEYQVQIPANHSKSPHHQKLAPFYPEVLPFRFAEIILPTTGVVIDSVTQYALYYPFDDNASSFTSSSDALNRVWDLSKYTLKATPFLGVYADGNRERMPYEADAYIQQLGHYNVDREYSVARYTAKFLLHHASWPTEWHMHMLMIAWQDYMYSGNSDFLVEYYTDLKVKTLHELAREDGLISSKTDKLTQDLLNRLHYDGQKFRDIVDWPKGTEAGKKQARNAGPTPEGERDGYVFTDYNTVVNAYHVNVLNIMSDIAEVVGNASDQAWFKHQASIVNTSMLEHMFDKDKGRFVDGIGTEHASLHANMFPLAFGLVPEEHVSSVTEFVKSRGMAASVYGAQHLLDGLYRVGEADYALSLMTSDSKRSWLNMLKVGSTMTTEAWDEHFKPNLTWNHAWGSAPANVIPRRLMGIEPVESGFKEFRIVPQPASLSEVRLTTPTIQGPIYTELNVSQEQEQVKWALQIDVPANTKAQLWVPATFNQFNVNGELYTSRMQSVLMGEKRKLIPLVSGKYRIEVY